MAVDAAAAGGASAGTALARRSALDLLVSWDWTLGEAREDGVHVSDGEAEKQLALSKSDLVSGISYEWFAGEAKLRGYLASAHVDQADQLWLVRLGMLATKLAHRRVLQAESNLDHARIADYYRGHKRDFYVGERRDIRAIMNWSRSQVLEAKREMQAGERFQGIAERFNQSIEGGVRLGRARGNATKRYERDYFAAPPHVLIGPLKELLYYVFEVFSIHRGYQKSLARAERTIRQRLAEHDAATTLMAADERRWRTRTRCLAGYATPVCAQSYTTG